MAPARRGRTREERSKRPPMLSKIPTGVSLRSFFSGLVEQVFMTEVGICDPAVTDYLGQMLVDFVHIDDIYRLRAVDGETIRDVSKMQAQASLSARPDESTRTRIINRYIGDFTLFWAGIYPENLRRPRSGGDRLELFLQQGRRSYGIASELSRPNADPPGELLRQLSRQFECCVHGLHLVRADWEQTIQSSKNQN